MSESEREKLKIMADAAQKEVTLIAASGLMGVSIGRARASGDGIRTKATLVGARQASGADLATGWPESACETAEIVDRGFVF
jgi:hypothetical protein